MIDRFLLIWIKCCVKRLVCEDAKDFPIGLKYVFVGLGARNTGVNLSQNTPNHGEHHMNMPMRITTFANESQQTPNRR